MLCWTGLTAGRGGITVPFLNRAVRMKCSCPQLTHKTRGKGERGSKTAEDARGNEKLNKGLNIVLYRGKKSTWIIVQTKEACGRQA